ncbi:hypothetical protein L3X38_037654 [Prunus dulcis]|uniref:Uncharacterized protein n=1 Tax=Prunus dulcis TaxID=3755 RepID=A0AAD4YPR6_PRUDU|nr:hypothetical protein L3X38_037654 [Prunus dulcis]
MDLDRTATRVVPQSSPAFTVEPAAAISSVFTESAPPSFSLLRRPIPTPEGGDDHAEFGAPDSADICCHSPASAATAPALMDHLVVGPAASSAHQHHRHHIH